MNIRIERGLSRYIEGMFFRRRIRGVGIRSRFNLLLLHENRMMGSNPFLKNIGDFICVFFENLIRMRCSSLLEFLVFHFEEENYSPPSSHPLS